jgi:hypothetical protein
MTDQLDIAFDGETYDPELDKHRLAAQLQAVRAAMLDGNWRTLAWISGRVGAPEASVSARLRDLRKPRFGAYVVERRRLERGLHEYRVLEPYGRCSGCDGPMAPQYDGRCPHCCEGANA